MNQFNFPSLRALSTHDEKELTEQHIQAMEHYIPLFGSLFGIIVLLFSFWDFFIDPSNAWQSLFVRIGFVAIGAIAYTKTPLALTVIQRFYFIYWTHVSAFIISLYLIKDGFLYGLSGLSTCVFIAALITYRFKIFFRVLSLPSIIFVVLNLIKTNNLSNSSSSLSSSISSISSLSSFSFSGAYKKMLNNLMMYAFSVAMAALVLLIIRAFRQKNFLTQKKLIGLTRNDFLTNANNRAYVSELAEHAFSSAKRHTRPLAIATIDIDFFKKVNDTYGHDIGDQVIQLLSTTCMQELRQIDHFGRMGGEEFICVLPDTAENEALLCMERLRKKVANLCLETPKGKIQFTISIGVAILKEHHLEWTDLLKDSDMAMYAAKNKGRNQTQLAN